MKNMIMVSSLCLLLCGCGEDVPPTKSQTYTPPAYKNTEPVTAATVQQTTAAAPAASQQMTAAKTAASTAAPGAPLSDPKSKMQRPSDQLVGNAAAAIDYGTGATPLNVKKRQEDKLQSIQNQYNQGTNKAINQK